MIPRLPATQEEGHLEHGIYVSIKDFQHEGSTPSTSTFFVVVAYYKAPPATVGEVSLAVPVWPGRSWWKPSLQHLFLDLGGPPSRENPSRLRGFLLQSRLVALPTRFKMKLALLLLFAGCSSLSLPNIDVGKVKQCSYYDSRGYHIERITTDKGLEVWAGTTRASAPHVGTKVRLCPDNETTQAELERLFPYDLVLRCTDFRSPPLTSWQSCP